VEEAPVSGSRHRLQSTPRCWGGGRCLGLCDQHRGWERSGTHVGARWPGGGEVRRDARGSDGRAAVRSCLDLAGCGGGCVDMKHCLGKSYSAQVSL
jgi:hypothetical protein